MAANDRWIGFWRRWGADLPIGVQSGSTTADQKKGMRGATAAKHADATDHSDVAHSDATHDDHSDGKGHTDSPFGNTAHSDGSSHADSMRFR